MEGDVEWVDQNFDQVLDIVILDDFEFNHLKVVNVFRRRLLG